MPRIEEMLGLPDGNYGPSFSPGYDTKGVPVENPKAISIYVASSWRNFLQPTIVTVLRKAGHDVYDYKNPPGGTGFQWKAIDEDWLNWTADQYRDALEHPVSKAGFKSDIDALNACDACLLVLPSGRSASWEFGYACGKGKICAVLMLEKCEPELMYLGNPILTSMNDLFDWSEKHGSKIL